MQRKPKPDKSSNNDGFSQKIHTNLVEHLQCIADPSKLMKALNLGCLYSLSGQNPDAAGDPQKPKRPTSFLFQRLDEETIRTASQAWKSLSNASGVSRSYLRPGVSAPIIDKEKLNSLSFRQGTPCQSNNGNIGHGSKDAAHPAGFIPENKDVGHRLSDESTSLRASTSYVGGQATPLEHKRTQTFSGPPPTSADVANFVGQPIMGIPIDLCNQTSMSSDTASSHRNMKGFERQSSQRPCLEESYQTACKFRPPVTSHGKSTSGTGERFLSPINLTSGESEEHFYSLEEDDDILQSIDLDQIVSEHYERGCSQQSTQVTSNVRTATPPSVESKSRAAFMTPGTTTLAETDSHFLCRHGVEVHCCAEAGLHLQEMKDKLILISNELLDNTADLALSRFEELRVER
jgi:hypothetical protein